MRALRSLIFALLFYPATVLLVLAALAGALRGRRGVTPVAMAWARLHRRLALAILGIRTRIEGPVPTGTVLVAAKHQSMYETLELILILEKPRIVMKRELADIPLWGRLGRLYGLIVVDREGGATALRRMLRDGEEAAAEGRSVVIFAEGTRVAPGEKPPLQPGFAGLYRMLKLPVAPLALDSGHVWPRRSFVKRPGTVTMRFGEAIPPGLSRGEIEARVHAAINALEA